MTAIADILHHIAQELGYRDAATAALALRSSNRTAIRACITPELEDAELCYLLWFGRGHTIYFRVSNYAAGRQLIEELAHILPNVRSVDCQLTADEGSGQPQLYLFMHVQEGLPAQPMPDDAVACSVVAQADFSPYKTNLL